MRTRKIVVVVAGALLLGTLGAMAQANRDQVLKVNLPKGTPGQMYDRSGMVPQADGPEPMPVPVDSAAGPVVSSTKLDPMFSSMGMNFGEGSALMTPRGGAMSSPQQQADRAIRRLIRRLD